MPTCAGLLTDTAAEKTTLSYAVGEWAKIWPLQTLIRAMGAFFVRRNSGDPLYRRVLERYVHMATKEGVCQAVFLEGGSAETGCWPPPNWAFWTTCCAAMTFKKTAILSLFRWGLIMIAPWKTEVFDEN